MKIKKSILIGVGLVAALAAFAVNAPTERTAPQALKVAAPSAVSAAPTGVLAVAVIDSVEDQAIRKGDQSASKFAPLLILPFMIGALRTSVTQDRSTPPGWETGREQHNKLIADFYYVHRNRSGTVAPVCARGTTATKAKTTNATTFIAGGLPIAKGATDDFWTLTGGVLAISSFRKYRLMIDTAGAASVGASSDAATAAACDFAARPADGVAIVGVLTVATDGATTFTPATTALNAAGITSTFIDGSDGLEILAAPVTQ